ncbi:MAG: universal stress protein [Acidobacteriia bacterium]|nr:universal stress protein [Terriglobia bacterium]
MKILLAIDESKSSQAAVQSVMAMALPPGSEVKVLHVVEPPSLLVGRELARPDLEFEAVWKTFRKHAGTLVAKATEALRKSGLNAAPAVEDGDPKAKILDVAKEWHADLIVIGSHGRKGLNRFLLGSVSEAVARHAHCSVEIVRASA